MRQLPPRQLDEHGERYIYAREAFRAQLYKDKTYWPDRTPRWAIGYGHTCSHAEEAQYRGVSLTHAEAAALFRADMVPRVADVNKLIKVEIGQHEVDAVISLVFNIGTRAFAKSSVLACLNAGDYAGAADHLKDWVYWQDTPGGPLVKSDGLVLRRTLDKELFLLKDDDEAEFDALLARVAQCQFDLTAELPSLQPGQYMHDQDPDTGGPL